jgi:hypothetical protein
MKPLYTLKYTLKTIFLSSTKSFGAILYGKGENKKHGIFWK